MLIVAPSTSSWQCRARSNCCIRFKSRLDSELVVKKWFKRWLSCVKMFYRFFFFFSTFRNSVVTVLCTNISIIYNVRFIPTFKQSNMVNFLKYVKPTIEWLPDYLVTRSIKVGLKSSRRKIFPIFFFFLNHRLWL